MIGGLTFSKIFENLKYKHRLLFAAVAITVVMMIVYAWSPVFWIALVAQAIGGWAISTVYAICGTLMIIGVPDTMRGRISGIYTFVFIGFMPFGALLASALVGVLGPQVIMTICAIGIAIIFSTLMLLMKGKFQEKLATMV